jgi:uncharacterized protein (UPF0305 family)
MKKLNDYLKIWGELSKKVNSERLEIYRIKDCGLYGNSYLFLIPKEIKDVKEYVNTNFKEENLKEILENNLSTIQKFKDVLEKENLSLENLNKLISLRIVQIRTNKSQLDIKKSKETLLKKDPEIEENS